MKDRPEARIILTRGTRLDLKAVVEVYDVNARKVVPFGTCGPMQQDIDNTIVKMKNQLERAGNFVSVIER